MVYKCLYVDSLDLCGYSALETVFEFILKKWNRLRERRQTTSKKPCGEKLYHLGYNLLEGKKINWVLSMVNMKDNYKVRDWKCFFTFTVGTLAGTSSYEIQISYLKHPKINLLANQESKNKYQNFAHKDKSLL